MTTRARQDVLLRSRERAIARFVTEACGPGVLVVGILFVVAIRNLGTSAGAAWAGVAILLCAGVPMAYVLRGVRMGKWADHHVADRVCRRTPLLVGSSSIGATAVLLTIVQAPRELVALVVAQFVVLATVTGVTHYWKISVHTATAGGVLGILTALYGPWALFGLIGVAFIAWSRTVLIAHTWTQLTAGVVTGFGVALGLFSTLR